MLLYRDYLRSLKKDINLIFAPSLIYLPLFKDEDLFLCTQNISLYDDLKLTGDITIDQLKNLNVKYALIGHFDKRKYYNENSLTITKKISIALKNNLKVIYCLGETKEELFRKVEYQIIERNIAQVFNNIPLDEFKNIIIAYEPTYLIGTKASYDIPKIKETIKFIKDLIKNYYDMDISIVFGGNITPENINDLIDFPLLDGFIIGSSSLNPLNVDLIIKKMTQKEN